MMLFLGEGIQPIGGGSSADFSLLLTNFQIINQEYFWVVEVEFKLKKLQLECFLLH